MEFEHLYNIWLGPDDPIAEQPNRILVPLKPHQLTALAKANFMERTGTITYHCDDPAPYIADVYARRNIMFRGRFQVDTNIGILGDEPGYGKTLTALSIVAANPTSDIYRPVHTRWNFAFGGTRSDTHFEVTCPRMELPNYNFFRTTLVMVPRGPVYVQWEKAIREQTQLRLLAIESLPFIRANMPPANSSYQDLATFFDQFDVVLIKSTTMKSMMDYYRPRSHTATEHPIYGWERIMVDEAHEILHKIPHYRFRFLWLITATYPALQQKGYSSRIQLSYAVRDIFNDERMNLVLIRGRPDYIHRSFHIPEAREHWYMCAQPTNIAAIRSFVNANVIERINANDIQGAVRELGGTNDTEEDIAALLARGIERDIQNKQREAQYIESLDIPAENKQTRLNNLNAELSRLRERLNSLRERITMLCEKTCPICCDNYTNPIVLPCTHVYCGGCLLSWMRSGHVCPECRAPIRSQQLMAVVSTKNNASSAASAVAPILTKEDTLLRIIREKPNGRFLIFSKCDSSFRRITMSLFNHGISYSEMKGSTVSMMHILERFRHGDLRCILLNTMYAGSGIDISCATDVVIFHAMGLDKTQAVGRAQRVGRTDMLHIHNLCYPNEMEIQTAEPQGPERSGPDVAGPSSST